MIGKKAKWTGSAVLAGGLLITGVAVGGPATPVTHPKTKAAASVTGTYADLDACGLMAPGRQGGCVEQLQLDLNDAENAGLTLDGHFGPSTEQAVIQFQKTTGVTPDGVVGAATKAALEHAIGANPPVSTPAAGTPVTSGPPPTSPASPATGSGGTPATSSPAASNPLATGLAVVTAPPAGEPDYIKEHTGNKWFGDKECSQTVPYTGNVQVCVHVGGHLKVGDYAAATGHNEFANELEARVITVQALHNPWIDFDYYSTGGQLIYHWQGPPHGSAKVYTRDVYTPVAGNYYDFAAAGNLCATLYDNPGQAPVEIARNCLSVGPDSNG